MMKPKFDDVIEYVRAGEDDPDLKKLLELHPNGKELLKQARFICRMLERKAGKDEETGGPAIAALSASFDSFDSVAESRELPDSDWLYVGETSETVPRGRPRQKWSGRGRRPVEELGTLVFTEEDDRAVVRALGARHRVFREVAGQVRVAQVRRKERPGSGPQYPTLPAGVGAGGRAAHRASLSRCPADAGQRPKDDIHARVRAVPQA